MLEELKRKINAKIVVYCGKMVSRLFYKFPVSLDPWNFEEMKLVDHDDLGTRIAV